MKKLCKYCNSDFVGKPKRSFCSKQCWDTFQIGRSAWNKGLPAPWTTGEKNSRWKGDSAGYRALHIWVQGRLGKASKCEKDPKHKSTRYHWGNISHEYKRDLSDWMQMCPSCNVLDRKVLSA